MAKPNYNTLPLPGNSSATQNFNSEQEWVKPDESKNGNLGFDKNYGGNPAKPLTGPSPFANLKGSR